MSDSYSVLLLSISDSYQSPVFASMFLKPSVPMLLYIAQACLTTALAIFSSPNAGQLIDCAKKLVVHMVASGQSVKRPLH